MDPGQGRQARAARNQADGDRNQISEYADALNDHLYLPPSSCMSFTNSQHDRPEALGSTNRGSTVAGTA